MIHGREFWLYTDHQQLLSIFGSKKSIPTYTANRLQRWALILLAYEFKIEYKNTAKFAYADALSRLIKDRVVNEKEDFLIASIKLEADVNRVLSDSGSNLPVTADRVKTETAKDAMLQRVFTYIKTSWPRVIKDATLKMFFNRRESLSENQGCMLSQDRVIIPLTLQAKVLKQLHAGHPGIVRMKALARSFVY